MTQAAIAGALRALGRLTGQRWAVEIVPDGTIRIVPVPESTPTAEGGNIYLAPWNSNQLSFKISISGNIMAGDDDKFLKLVAGDNQDIIILESPGGELYASINIGTVIRARNFVTFVGKDHECASGCAFAWLAGNPRVLDVGGHVGFHGAYGADGKPTSGGNAILGAYLRDIGLSLNAVIYMAWRGSNDMEWLTPYDAKKLGIQVIMASNGKIIEDINPAPLPQPKQAAQNEPSQSKTEQIVNSPDNLAKPIEQRCASVRVASDDGYANMRARPQIDGRQLWQITSGSMVRYCGVHRGAWWWVSFKTTQENWAHDGWINHGLLQDGD